MTEQTEGAEVEALARLIRPHRRDSMSQDSGEHCDCGSDSRFVDRHGRGPWASIAEHKAQVILASDWLAAREAAAEARGAQAVLAAVEEASQRQRWDALETIVDAARAAAAAAGGGGEA